MYLSVKSVKPLNGYKLLLKFENNEEKVFDVSPYLDLDPELLYQKSTLLHQDT